MARAYTSSKSGITTSFIRRYINKLPENKLFTTRELLPYGSRCAVDKVLSRMVEEGRIKRWARGVFTLWHAAKPTIEDIARVKAESFGRKIISYCGQAAKAVGLGINTSQMRSELKNIYCINGRSSSFMVGNRRGYERIYLKQTIPRKLKLEEEEKDRISNFIRGLWYLGKEQCDEFAIEIARQTLRNRWERTEVRQLANIMPSWLADKLSRWKFSPSIP